MAQRVPGKGGSSLVKAANQAARSAAVVVNRSDMIVAAHVNKACKVHNGRQYVLVRPTAEMVSYRLKFGEFAKTRISRAPEKKATKVVKHKK